MKYKIGDKVIYKGKETIIAAVNKKNEYIIEYAFGWIPGALYLKNKDKQYLKEGKVVKDKCYHYATEGVLRLSKSITNKQIIIDNYSIY